MAADDAEEQPQIGGGCRHRFPVGSLVEVLVNEEDMRGVYFTATVVPPPLSPRKSDTKASEERLYVRYQNLLARKNRSERLREFVDVSSVRPAPPLQKAAGRFEPDDVVDAFYNDGWWVGVVSRVVGGGFVVKFECPPDERVFGPSALRAHWDWADGVWAGPRRKGKVGNANAAFEAGAKVEISIEEFKGAWFSAAVVRDSGNGAYLVELKDRNGVMVEAEVDSVHIRPSPPVFEERDFGVSENVDAFFDFGWWSGLIKQKVDRNGYIVFFEETNLNRLFQRWELRRHIDWNDGEWLIGRKSDLGFPLRKHNPQIEHANQETQPIVEDEDVVDHERRTKRREDLQIPSSPNPIDVSSPPPQLQSTPNSKRKRHESDRENPQTPPAPPEPEKKLPFVKRNEVWKAVESMAVLKALPQKPHFEPLRRFKESEREGLAIGCMVTFANAVEASRALRFGDPKPAVDDLLETLLDLERHGLEARAVLEGVARLAAAKAEEERLVERVRGIKDEIAERRGRRSKIEGEMWVIDDHMGRLREQLRLAEAAKAEEVEEIARLEAGLEGARREMERLRCGFEGVVAASVFSCDG